MRDLACSPAGYLFVAAMFVLAAVIYFAIGLRGAVLMRNRGWIPSELVALVTIGVTAVIAYGVFWLYLWKPAVGKVSSIALLLVVAAAHAHRPAWRRTWADFSDPDIRYPALMVVLLGLFYIGVTYGGVFPGEVCALTHSTFVNERVVGAGSPDYLIQMIWAEGLYSGRPPWNYVLDPDLSRTTVADRPPLLASMALILYGFLPNALRFLGFMAATTAASLVWIPALWALLRSSGLTTDRAVLATIGVSQTYYFWYSSIFTWPKALSGAMAVGAIVLLVVRPVVVPGARRPAETVIGAVLAGLSMVAHFSAALLLLVTGLFLLHPRLFPGWRASAAAAAAFLLITGSYFAVKSVKETNLSNQTKYTLSVPDTSPVEPLEYKGLSTMEAVQRAYAKISLSEAVENKIYNLRQIFRLGCFLGCPGQSVKQSLWGSELWPIMGSMKLFNVGWLLFAVPLMLLFPMPPAWRGRLAYLAAPPMVSKATFLYLSVAAVGLFIYGVVSFRQSVSNILSSGFMLLLFAALSAMIFSLPRYWLWWLLAAPAAYFASLVSLASMDDALRPNLPLLALLAIAVCATVALGIRATRLSAPYGKT